jgi:general secretion pathway protein G
MAFPKLLRWLCAVAGTALLVAAFFHARPQNSATPAADEFLVEAAAQYQLQRIQAALIRFSLDNRRPPTVREGLTALVHAPPGLSAWRGPYIDRVPADPWGRPYCYTGREVARGFIDIFSAGPDGWPGTGDDIHNYGVDYE